MASRSLRAGALQETRPCIPVATVTAGVHEVSAVCDPKSLSTVAVMWAPDEGLVQSGPGRVTRSGKSPRPRLPIRHDVGHAPSGRRDMAGNRPGLRAIDWEAWFGCPEGADYLSPAGHEVTTRAMADLTAFFDSRWLPKAVTPFRNSGRASDTFVGLGKAAPVLQIINGAAPGAWVEAVRWWAAYAYLQAAGVPGLASLRRDARRDVTLSRFLHTQTQARLALMGRPADSRSSWNRRKPAAALATSVSVRPSSRSSPSPRTKSSRTMRGSARTAGATSSPWTGTAPSTGKAICPNVSTRTTSRPGKSGPWRPPNSARHRGPRSTS